MYGAYELISSTAQSGNKMSKSEKSQIYNHELPSHLQLSYEHSRNPWQNLFMQDFILIAEFSENEGPRPLFTIPEYAGEVFNKNAFSVHVMSVDYQTQTSNSLLVEDTQLVFLEDRENIYAYVHHFILYDIEARGFVRPFCMCYISNSKKKVLSNLENFIQEFSKISAHFKDANKPVFYGDLKERLSDLNYIKDFLRESNKMRVEDDVGQKKNRNVQGLNEEVVDSMLCDTNKAITALETSDLVIKKLVEDDMAEVTISGDDENNFDEIVRRVLRERRRHTLTLRDIHKLCSFRANEGLSLLQKLHQNFYQSFEVFSIIKEETACLDPFSSVLTVGGSYLMNFRNNINISTTQPIPFAALQKIDHGIPDSYHSASSVTSVDSYQSCVEDNEEGNVQQEQIVKESNLYVSTQFSKVTLKDLLRPDVSTNPICDETTTEAYTSSDNHSISTSENVEEDNDTTQGNSPKDENPVFQDTSRDRSLGKHRHSTGELTSLGNTKSRLGMKRQVSAVETKRERLKTESVDVPRIRSEMIRNDMSSFVDIEHFPLGTTPKYTVVYKDLYETNEVFLDDSHKSENSGNIFVQCYAQQLSRRKDDGPGGGILRVLRDYGYLVHLLYALLRGRTVVILGEPAHERAVQSLVTALWLFVPGDFRGDQQVVLWREKPLKLADLGRFKLVGLCKSKKRNVLSNSVESHVTTLDFESGCLKTLPYQGEFLNEMLASRRCWKTDTVFMSYVHSIFLEISLKAFVCYYVTTIATSRKDETQSWRKASLLPRKFSIEHMTDILDALGILGSDANIILYFIDLLVRQQTNQSTQSKLPQPDGVSLDGSSLSSTASNEHLIGPSNFGPRPRPITLDFSERMMFRNKGSES